MDINHILLIGGQPALDFINTVEERGTGTELNYLSEYATLALWCVRVGLISDPFAQHLLGQAAQHPVSAERVWEGAMDFRQHLTRIIHAIARSKNPPKVAVSAFNATLAQAFVHRRLQPSESGDMDWSWKPAGMALEIPIWEIVLSATDLMTNAQNRQRIRFCANGSCGWAFLDTSRNGRRRWCRMADCGNIAKVRRFRERQRSA